MTEASLQINFANRQDLADPYWLRMELVEEDTQMTIGEAATLIDELYHTSICGEEQTPLPEPEDGSEAKPLAADWTAALQKLNLPTCDAYNQLADGNPGGYEVDIKVYRSHQKELYKLILSNGIPNAPRRMQEKVEITLTIDNQFSILLDKPIVSSPRIAWTDIDGPNINIRGNTLWWEGTATGTLRAEYNSVYDLVHILVTGTQTGQTVIEGTLDAQWLGAGWYSGSETGEELTDVQDIQCSVLAFYHYQYEELVLNRPETDESVDDTDLTKAVCRQAGSTTVNDDDGSDPSLWDISACKEACTQKYEAGSEELKACQDACERQCYKKVRYNNICTCGGDETSTVEYVQASCPDGYNSGSLLNGGAVEEGSDRYIDCGVDAVNDPAYYESKCCYPWPWPTTDKPLPECFKHYAPFTGQKLTEEQTTDLKQKYGDDANIIIVGPSEGSCGQTITEQEVPSGDCCEFVDPIVWDDENSVEVLSPLHNGYVSVTGGADALMWSIRGTDITFEGGYRDVIAGRTVRLIAGEDFCGTAYMTVTDGCSSVTGLVMSTIGEWVLLEIVSGFHPEICNAGYVNWPSNPALGSGYLDANGRRYILRPIATELGCSSSGYGCTSGTSECCALYVDCESSGPKPCIDKFYHGSSGGTYYENWNDTNVYAVNGRICVDGYPGDPAVFSVAESTTEVWGWDCDS